MTNERSEILRFGTFEVDMRSGELRKQGVRIKLQEQPFHVLSVLLQRAGEVVTREELRNQNWPADTFVDFDNSLNTAINKLREALGDSADNPRFIETMPRRGYRFVAPVTGRDGTLRGTGAVVSPVTTPRGRKIVVVAAVAVLAAGIAGGLIWRARQARRLTEKDTIVLGDFANSTGDAVFDGTLREGLSVQLHQSPFLSLLSEEGIHQTLRMMEKAANTRLTPEITREVCQRTSSAAALEGSIALIGTRYNLILKAVNCANGDLLASTEAQANDKSHVLDALGKAASEMRRRLGESLSTVQKYNAPLEQATTSSLEALQAYSLGSKSGDFPTAIPFLRRAIQLDPGFAMAYDQLGGAYGSIGEGALGVENTRKAFELRGRVSELEKLNIEADYYNGVTGNLIEAQRSYALGEQIYPREPGFCGGLGVTYMSLGQYESALKEHQKALRLLPNDSVAFRFVAYTYLLLDRVEDAAAKAREAHAKGLDSALGPTVYSIAFYQNDAPEMARQVAAAAGKTGEEDLLLALNADTAAYFGHLGRARELSRQASNSAKRAGEKETSAAYQAMAGLREGLFGNSVKGLEQTRIAMTPSSGRDIYYGFGLASAYAKNAKATQRFVEDFEKGLVEDTDVQFNYLPTLRAKLALIHSNPQQAIDSLELAAPYELGLPAGGFYNWPNMYPVYVRGEAFLAAHRGREASAEFQKILDHRGIVLNEPIGALAHLQLGRAYAMQGDTAKARIAYNDFLTLWKDADPDIPILREAKSEYAKLQSLRAVETSH
ncbi:MAG TPA: winged helix-turn-helix domain-containing protein [Candidatus Saccharimonadales bacterium]|jgi:DNA-binding winged helix-turn-helix (wHTH) protein/tetratricopeptide (TPR) repeat protein|nr:winged helix-turn-helix domain-containing protein [Candidatus Saccharimonadales bacterium]